MRSLPANTFWGSRWHQVRDVTVPLLLDRLEQHGAVDNLRTLDTPRRGWWFADSDVFKWLEAACWAGRLDLAEPVAEIAVAAQAADGYLHSFFGTKRYERLAGSHELYCMGHFIEAACAHHTVTGETWLLDAAIRVGEHVCTTFGAPGERSKAVDGHPEIELALCTLSRLTGERRYAIQARRFVSNLGDHTLDRPSGHAVRALYLATGAHEAARLLDDHELAERVHRWWTLLVDQHMYVTGGVGGRWLGEAIGRPYELPNEMAYAETCAAVAAARLAAQLGDEATEDRIVHNALLAGVGADGNEWFYSCPLSATSHTEANPWALPGDFSGDALLERFPARRLPWYDVTCCPTNLTRWLAALPWWRDAARDPVADARAATPRIVTGHPRNESVRGCVAVQLGSFVLCAEQDDQPSTAEGVPDVTTLALNSVGDVVFDESRGLPQVRTSAQQIGWADTAFDGHETIGPEFEATLTPFFAWANRSPGAMAVWFRNSVG